MVPKCSVQTSKFLLMSESVHFVQIVTIKLKIIIVIIILPWNKPMLCNVVINHHPVQTVIKMNGQNVHVLAFILISNKGLDQNYPYYWKAYNNDRIRVRSCKHISSGRTALEHKSQRLEEWLDQMSLLTTHHLMQTLLYTWCQPRVSHCPGQTRRDGPCLPSPLVFLIMCFFFSFFSLLSNFLFSLPYWDQIF